MTWWTAPANSIRGGRDTLLCNHTKVISQRLTPRLTPPACSKRRLLRRRKNRFKPCQRQTYNSNAHRPTFARCRPLWPTYKSIRPAVRRTTRLASKIHSTTSRPVRVQPRDSLRSIRQKARCPSGSSRAAERRQRQRKWREPALRFPSDRLHRHRKEPCSATPR